MRQILNPDGGAPQLSAEMRRNVLSLIAKLRTGVDYDTQASQSNPPTLQPTHLSCDSRSFPRVADRPQIDAQLRTVQAQPVLSGAGKSNLLIKRRCAHRSLDANLSQ
jgi:hypothetical protein